MMSLFLEERDKKALVRLQLFNKETKEVERELGFATKIRVPDKQDPEEKNVLLITSASIFPDNIDEHLDDIVVHRWKGKSKQKDPAKVKNIENCKQADVSTVVFEGGDKKLYHTLQYKVLTEKDLKKKEHKKLSACVFEGKKKIVLEFGKEDGSYKLSNVSKKDFDVKRAKGAPVIIAELTHHFMGIPRYALKIVGVLSINSNGDLYPVLFKDGFLDESLSSSDIAEAGPSGIDVKQSDEMPSSSDTAEAGPSGIDKKQSGEDVQTKKPRTASDNRERDHAEDSNKLKEAIKGNTQNQPKFLDAHDVTSAKTDDIFTNLTVYYADKKQEKKEQAKGLSRREQLQEYTKRTAGFKVKKCEDIFIDKKRENPKTLLLIGKAGVGKTMFSEKVMRDWSMNRLFQNENTLNIKFAYLLKFRQLSSHGDKELNLHELLNCCPLLDDKSYVDDSLFEYLTKNPSEVLIILDGFDEYSEQHRKQIASDFEQKYPNDALAKMPIPALCSKLFKGKVFKNSVVLVCSRPGEAEDLRKTNVDRYVEISGFSPEQVTEYVDKYFSEPEKERTKNTVREHVEKNENLVSFCHIPLLSFLLCWCLEWRITQSGMTENLPAKITDLYDEVVKVFVQKLHALLKYLEMSKNTKKVAQETLDKLAELAANLLKESKYIFDEDDMIKLNLSQDEIENLKVSGILHCVPGIRISAFETKDEYSFTHLTLQEYLSASFFIKKKEIPDNKKVSGQTLVFMSGCLRGKDVKLLKKLIQQITPEDDDDDVNKLLMLQCLYEYGEDKLTELTINNLYDKYCDSHGWIRFDEVTDVDIKYISYLLDVIHLLKEQHPPSSSGYILYISYSPLTSFGVGVVCDSLVRNSFITGLWLNDCSLDDKCVEKITDSLVNTGITDLYLHNNNITDEGVESICSVLTKTKITDLYLHNNNITDEGVESICSVLTKTKITDLYLHNNNITDEGVESICSVLTKTKITDLDLGENNITDEGVESICSVLTKTKITDLDLGGNKITDEGAESICRVIIQDDCHVEVLELLGNDEITAECKERVKELVQKHKPGVRLII